MSPRYDLIIVGMGSGGMVAAEFAASLDLEVAVIERDRVGGDCLWTGCVPSKAFIASAKVAHQMRTAGRYGITAHEPEIDTAKVFARVREVQQRIATSDDDPERFRALGIDLRLGHPAKVTGPHTVEVDGETLEAKYILLCTGSRPVVPPIPGLQEAGFLTSETVWESERAPERLVLIGGGPISIELAQAFNRLGTQVTVLQRDDRILPRDEPELVERLLAVLRAEGVEIHLGADVSEVRPDKTVIAGGREFPCDEILVGAGRKPNVEELGLGAITVDERSRTATPSVYAVGDIAGRHLFTHSAASEGVKAVRDMFFPGKGRFDQLVPWCTFTDPELAHAGLTIDEARKQHGHDNVDVWRMELSHSDRARADGHDDGLIIVVTAKKRVVGAHILGAAAGELIQELALAIQEKMRFSDLASLIHVYPTLSTSIAQLAAEAAFENAARYKWLVRT